MRYSFCGLSIASELPLPAAAPVAGEGHLADVTVRLIARSWAQASGAAVGERPVASPWIKDWGEIRNGRDGYTLRYGDVCTLVVAASGRQLDAYVPSRDHLEQAGHLCIGNAMALLIAQRSALALHASAVACSDGVVAIAGASGAGKSSLAAWLVRAGGALVADDLLRVEADAAAARCYPGAVELRMRPGVPLASSIAAEPARISYDGRRVLQPAPRGHGGRQPLRAIVCPQLEAEGDAARLRALPRVAAFTALARTVRPSGLLDPALRALQFHRLAGVVRTLPVYALTGRWHEVEVLEALQPLRLPSTAADAAAAWRAPGAWSSAP